MKEVITIWASAIQHFEGWFPGSRSYRNNNPGNLEEEGTAGRDGLYAKFASYQDGFDRLCADLETKIMEHPHATLLQIMNIYAPSADHNNPGAYTAYVAAKLNQRFPGTVSVATTMAQLALVEA